MKNYDVVQIYDNKRKILIIFSTNYVSPLKELNKIQSLIRDLYKDISEIYFDFLLCNRNGQQRYAKIECVDGILDYKKFSYISVNKENRIRELSAKYYRENERNLDWTYAGEEVRKMLINNIVL